MPLYLERRGRMFYIRGTAGPKGRRVPVNESTGTDRRDLAEEELARREAEIFRAGVYGERAVVLFADAAASYEESKPHLSAGDLKRIRRLVAHFGAAKLSEVNQAGCDRACRVLVGAEATPATKLRAVITPLSAILTHASRRDWCARPAFERPAPGPARTDWLTPADAERLITAAADHLKPLLAFLFGTGARAGEAITLRWSDVDLTAGTVVFRNVPGENARRTKSGRDRVAHLPPRAVAALGGIPFDIDGKRIGCVFKRPGPWKWVRQDGEPVAERGAPEPYQGERGQFRTGWDAAWRRAGLPGHMSPHSARHSWASWRYAVKSDALDLMRAGGWSSLDLVARYAHECPVDLVPAITKFWGAHPDEFPAAMRGRTMPAAEARTA